MYEKFYGLSEKPFHIAPNPEYLYLSSKHQNALTYMEYGIREGAGFILLTGEIGTGKTTLIRYILNQIDSEMEVAVIFNTNVNSDQLLELILREFELDLVPNDKPKNLEILYQYLIKKYAKKEKVLLIIDEAQNLSDEVLEEVRMLSNLQTDDDLLLQIMFVGQPELKTKLKRHSLSQLSQRIFVNYHLMPLTHDETGVYIATRIKRAGGTQEIFTTDAIKKIYCTTEGIPRLVNLVCDSALVYGYADELATIDELVIDHVIKDKGDLGLIGGNKEARNVDEIPESTLRATGRLIVDEDRSRIEALEADMQQLKMQVQWQIEELEKRAETYKDDLVRQLRNELEETKSNHKMFLNSYGQLQKKYRELKTCYEARMCSPENDEATLRPPSENYESDNNSTNENGETPLVPKKTSWFSRVFIG